MILTSSDYFILFAASFISVSALTPIMRILALRYGVIDSPTESHKTHKNPIPYLGGVAIVIGVVAVSYGASLVSNFSKATFWLASSALLPAIFMGLIGLIDDIKKLTPWSRFLVQNAVGLISAITLVATNTVGSPTGSKILDVLVSVLWIVGLTNAINFFDNVDGGASGTVAISALFLFILAFEGGQILISALAIVVVGATLGFLLWNRPPARIYMGDAGALFLGLLIASLTIRLEPNPINDFAAFSIPFFLMAIPIMDTSVAVIKRIYRGVSPFQGGRDHLSHRLMRLGLSKRQAVFSLWLLTLFFSSYTLLLSNIAFHFEGLYSSIGLIIWFSLTLIFLNTADE